ncbi:hypothetical protein K402DRAFT_389433 [Aulographum hederae CBS 113979]|uniref:Uncharacterized protein n=1 Tax=Aulographum hederae CBS 113979 TaxID=1176131 RepID=A0A6G1HDY4_9PEZI|nr:hypothetical protein K402DRAFT_389433 [Aulographum hederae CBS 113979]
MTSPGRSGWVSSPNTRGTIDIIWSCVLVLFVCVWTVLHHNVPTKADRYWTIVNRKLRWAMLAICAPEVLTLFAIMQWNAANISVREMKEFGLKSWSKTHAFYANSGGFILEAPDFPKFPINATSIHYLCCNGRIDPPSITRESIWDRSKADRFAKGAALVQTAWLLLQTIARAAQHLDITPLELFTVAFIVPTVATAYFWSDKPQNVEEPTVIKVDWRIEELLQSAGEAAEKPYVDTPLDFVEKPMWDGWSRRRSLLHFGGLKQRPLARIPNDYSPPPPTGKEALFVWTISVLHAMVHLLGWNFSFPSYPELIIWRVSSLILFIVMVVGGAVPVLSTQPWFDFEFSLLWIWYRESREKTWVKRWLFNIVVELAYASYVVARLFIFAEMFSAFRSLPNGAYKDVDWTSYLPHA